MPPRNKSFRAASETVVKEARRGLRPEIQALRAAAVLLVVLYHLWPQVLTGGYVGVDVFFVISGFLITGHLLREVERTGRVRLAEFWARRARRLLPASFLVLLATAGAVFIWIPQIFWIQFLRETVASALYVENWVLASDSVNYLATSNVASAAQHYWSLSVEEQFYAIWPLLIVVAMWLGRRASAQRKRIITGAVLGVVVLASFACSVIVTAGMPAAAYFVTPTRAWEFGCGGLLALLPASVLNRGSRLKPFIAWLGWVLILVVGVKYSSSTSFPGTAASLPVIGTLAVIWAGTPVQGWSPTRAVSLPPVQWLGNISYSLYLWHWPLIVIAPYVFGYSQLALGEKSLLLALAVLLAWLTKRWIEDPVRSGAFLASKRPRRTFGLAGAAMIIVVVPALIGVSAVQANVNSQVAVRAKLSKSACFGAASIDPMKDCSTSKFPVISPDPALAPQDSPAIYFTQPPCLAGGTALPDCEFGDPASSLRVALIGDSHAAQWEPALQQLAEKYGWDLHLYLKTNCAFTAAKRSASYSSCSVWSSNVAKALKREKPFDLVLTSFFAENLGLEIDDGSVTRSAAEAGFRQVWKPLIKRGSG